MVVFVGEGQWTLVTGNLLSKHFGCRSLTPINAWVSYFILEIIQRYHGDV
jgi:hypothetical protein